MKDHGNIAILLSITLIIGLITPIRWDDGISRAATPELSRSGMSVRVGEGKVLKMKNTAMAVTWSVKSGKEYISLKKKKKKQVTVYGKAVGNAVVKAVITYSAKDKKTYTCKVVVRKELWQCPVCGTMNDGMYCENCGQPKPGTTPEPSPTPVPTPTPTGAIVSTYTPIPTSTPRPGTTVSPGVSASPSGTPWPTFTPAPTQSPTPTPVGPDVISDKNMVMLINNIPISMTLYANSSAVTFYQRISNDTSGAYTGLNLEPVGSNEFAVALPSSIPNYLSESKSVEEGELFLYGTNWLKLSTSAHSASITPTRIAKPRTTEDKENLKFALTTMIGGRVTVTFKYKI
ncbi:MAG: hypothetical protein J5819_03090 [Eubacterium sp.]|nr:hypothetical protein [Eubacterium sp.]